MKKQWENFTTYFKITLPAAVFGLAISGVRWIWDEYIQLYVLNEGGMISWIAGGLITGLYITFATVSLIQAMEKRSALMGAIRNKDEHEFMDHVDLEISPILRYLMGNLALLVIIMFLTVEVPSTKAAIGSAFVISYVFALVREIVLAYDNPLESKKWPMKCVPDEWRKKILDPKRKNCQ